jgi:hypothetical protein
MTVKLTAKQMCKKSMVVLICLLMIGNLVQGTVLCFGTDGHVELESAFHKRCDHSVQSYASDQNQLSYEAVHEKNKHCEPCVDVPISIGLAETFRMPEQFNNTYPVPAANLIVAGDKVNFSEYDSASNTFAASSYFTPLRTVVLIV